MSVTQPAVRVQDEDVGTGAACTYKDTGKGASSSHPGTIPFPGLQLRSTFLGTSQVGKG